MQTIYLDAFSGISGNMFLAALIELGVDQADLESALGSLGLTGWSLKLSPVIRGAISCLHLEVEVSGKQPARHLSEIENLVSSSSLGGPVKQEAMAVFYALAAAEGAVHGIPAEKVHFHEVGAVDALVDVVGTVWALHQLGRPELIVSPLPLGRGEIQCAHGRLPNPAPATIALLEGIPVYGVEEEMELVTPTGAALVKVLAADFGLMPAMISEKVGYGAGTRELSTPNCLRAILGRTIEKPVMLSSTIPARAGEELIIEEAVVVLETSIDDMSPQNYEHLVGMLFESGALDVVITPVQMKKNRPAIALTILAPPGAASACRRLVLRETTTLGIRWHVEERSCLPRRMVKVDTDYGPITLKVTDRPGLDTPSAMPEYEDLKRAAVACQVPLELVRRAALRAFETG